MDRYIYVVKRHFIEDRGVIVLVEYVTLIVVTR